MQCSRVLAASKALRRLKVLSFKGLRLATHSQLRCCPSIGHRTSSSSASCLIHLSTSLHRLRAHPYSSNAQVLLTLASHQEWPRPAFAKRRAAMQVVEQPQLSPSAAVRASPPAQVTGNPLTMLQREQFSKVLHVKAIRLPKQLCHRYVKLLRRYAFHGLRRI